MSRLLIRAWTKSDIPTLAKHLNNKRIWDNCRDVLLYPYVEEDAARFIESVLHQDERPSQWCQRAPQSSTGEVPLKLRQVPVILINDSFAVRNKKNEFTPLTTPIGID